jgi:ATP-dependent helicase/nuclease subunit A
MGAQESEAGLAAILSALTPQQASAVTCREASVVLSSGAGCGKTHVLTQRYLSHLREDGAEVSQIVAITFTDRAARQMRERIRQALLHNLRAAGELEQADRWAHHLRGLETAQISTMHAFSATLLRQHAVEAGLDPRFDVLEDVLSVNLEAEALTDCLQRLLTSPSQAGEDLRDLVLVYGWRPVVEAVLGLVRAWDEPQWAGWRERDAGAIAADLRQYARRVLLPRYVRYVTAACPKIARCLWLLRQTPPRPGSKASANASLLLEGVERLGEAQDLAAAVEQLHEAAKVGREGAKVWPSEEAYQAIKAAFEGFRTELKGHPLHALAAAPDDLAAAVAVGQRFLRVAGEAVAAYRDLKRRRGVVDFQDLLVLARNLLRDHPEVRERLQRRYRYLLIDELQDTDPVQMELVEHLCGEGLVMGKLFAVGDAAQSIYRFRRADVHLFRGLRQHVPQEGRLGLTVNFRSQPAILDFTNALLGHHLQDFEPLVAHHPQVSAGACVEFLWSPHGDKEHVAEARAREADGIARRILRMIAGEKLVVERGRGGATLRPVRPGDIVLLFRTMSHVQLYEAALRKHGLNYYLVGGRAFFAQQEIYDLLNLLRALENPHDAVSLAGTLRAPFCCLSDEALFHLGRHRDGLWAGLHDPAVCAALPPDQVEPAGRAREHLDRWRGLKDRLPIARLLGEVFADSGYDAATQFEFLADRKLANLWKLVDLARTFDRSGLFGLAEFIQRLGDLVRTQPREEQAATQPENADVVRLMTIHQAKGLEFPVVFVPDLGAAGGSSHQPVARWDPQLGCVTRPPADEEPLPFPDFGWGLWKAQEAVEEWHEELRTLYVACTRAQDYLVLSAYLKQPARPDNAWMLTLAERFDLATGRCLVPDLPADRVPKVRVTDPLDTTEARQERGKPGVPLVALGTDGVAGVAAPARIAPIPLREGGRRIFTVAEVQAGLGRSTRAGKDRRSRGPAAHSFQFDAEDGSDRHAWVRAAERLGPAAETPAGVRDRIVRAVLERWDFRDREGWRPWLARELAGLPEAGAAVTSSQLAPLLTAFAASETYRLLREARTCYREIEFLLEWPESGDGIGPRPPPAIRGITDCLWQDVHGSWHVLAFTTDPVEPAQRRRYWRAHRLGLILGARGVEQGLGEAPASGTLFFLDGSTALRCRRRGLQDRRVLDAVAAVLTAAARPPSSR